MGRRRATAADYERQLLAAQQLIAAHVDEPIEPQAIARAAGLSLHHFHRIFRAQLGESVMQHVRRLRLERAARRLRTTELRLIELASEAGYESHEAFTRAFIEQFGIAPSEYRTQPSARLTEWLRTTPAAPRVQVRVETFEPIRVAYVRHRGGYAHIHETWARLRSWAEARGLITETPTLFGACPDDPEVTDESQLRFDACVRINDDFHDSSLPTTVLPGGTFAVGLHVGPFHLLHETYLDVIGRWFPSSGYAMSVDPVIEHYLDDPRVTAPEVLRTEVRVRIADDA